MKLKYKIILSFFIVFSLNIYAIDVIIAKDDIKYKEKIDSTKLMLFKSARLKKDCKAFTIKMYNNNTFVSKHYINKGSIICLKDIKVYKKDSVIFQFGSLEIEKEGKILFQNNKYITIKKSNGKIEKIYKDGKTR